MSATDPSRVAVVIPALNEERAIRGVVESVLAICPNVIVVDDGSTDATVERIADLPITLIRHATSLGKGQGLRDGFRKARSLGFDAVVAMDGDGQHLAVDIPRMLAAAQRYPEHLVIGARIRNRENQPKARRRANDFADWGISWGCGITVADTQSGQRYYPSAALELSDIAADDFVFEAAVLIAVAREKAGRRRFRADRIALPGRIPHQPFPSDPRCAAHHLVHGQAHLGLWVGIVVSYRRSHGSGRR